MIRMMILVMGGVFVRKRDRFKMNVDVREHFEIDSEG